MSSTKAYPCLCCGYKTITKKPPGSYEICPICCWEDSSLTPDESVQLFYTSNEISLIQAQRNFLSFGACSKEWLNDVRPPKEEESRESDWQPIELRLHRQWHKLLDRFNPSDTGLWDWLRTRVDDDMLQEMIFAENYGWPGYNYKEEMRFLKRVRDESWKSNETVIRQPGRKTQITIWYPVLSVIEHTRYYQPDKCSNEIQLRTYLKKAFGCTCLLRIYSESQSQYGLYDDNGTIIELIDTVLHLDKETWELTLQLLSWRVLSIAADEEEIPFFFMGILLIASMLFRSEADGFLLYQLGEMVISEEERIRDSLVGYPDQFSPEFLLGLNKFSSDFKINKWKKITEQILINPPNPHPQMAASLLQDIGRRVVNGNKNNYNF